MNNYIPEQARTAKELAALFFLYIKNKDITNNDLFFKGASDSLQERDPMHSQHPDYYQGYRFAQGS